MTIYKIFETNNDTLFTPAALIGVAGAGLLVSKLASKKKTKWGLTNNKNHTNDDVRDAFDDISSSWVRKK